MKAIKLILAIVILIGVAVGSYALGKKEADKYYNAASRMSDLIRHYEDDLRDKDLEIQDWGCFEELEGIYLWDDMVGEPIKLEDYVYCY